MGRIVTGLALAAALYISVPAHARAQATGASCASLSAGSTPHTHSIIAFGDGVTWGVNATRNCVTSRSSPGPLSVHLPGTADTTYPADLSRLLHAEVLDYGVRGEKTEGGLKRIAGVLAATQPSTVLVLEGFQDLLRGDTPSVIASRLILIGQLIQSYGALPVLLTLYLPSSTRLGAGKVRMLDDFIRNQSHLRGFHLVDLAGVLRGRAHALAAGLYPTDTGYRVLAAAIADALHRH
jgi:lysophospholipase L1-like esterase